MDKHEQKNCPRCNAVFECKVGAIAECQCYGIQLSDEEKAFVESKYKDCLCRNCLDQIANLRMADCG